MLKKSEEAGRQKRVFTWLDKCKHKDLQAEILAGYTEDHFQLSPNSTDEVLFDVAARATQQGVSSALKAYWCKAAAASTVLTRWRQEAPRAVCNAAQVDWHHPITYRLKKRA